MRPLLPESCWKEVKNWEIEWEEIKARVMLQPQIDSEETKPQQKQEITTKIEEKHKVEVYANSDSTHHQFNFTISFHKSTSSENAIDETSDAKLKENLDVHLEHSDMEINLVLEETAIIGVEVGVVAKEEGEDTMNEVSRGTPPVTNLQVGVSPIVVKPPALMAAGLRLREAEEDVGVNIGLVWEYVQLDCITKGEETSTRTPIGGAEEKAVVVWDHKLEKRDPDLSEVEMMMERFAKLLLGRTCLMEEKEGIILGDSKDCGSACSFGRGRLSCKNYTNQILKAAMTINSSVLAEVEIPGVYKLQDQWEYHKVYDRRATIIFFGAKASHDSDDVSVIIALCLEGTDIMLWHGRIGKNMGHVNTNQLLHNITSIPFRLSKSTSVDYRAMEQIEVFNSSKSPILQFCGGAVSLTMQPTKLS
ncbi:hypothetical protein PIB30_019480 [Stylosanthes scabra]|uniref:Uncharacterized protein n=1 Tax=Stylosanthes scabra TaxID=79078 RepID=A0ABU6T928_9FABA|nr:hypothetical protein [Stylosanthes scabra]